MNGCCQCQNLKLVVEEVEYCMRRGAQKDKARQGGGGSIDLHWASFPSRPFRKGLSFDLAELQRGFGHLLFHTH